VVLYRLPELLEANYDEPVFVVEREQDADRLARLGLVTTTQAFGLGQWDEAYSAHLADRPIVLLSTTDPASAQHAQLVAGSVIRVADGVTWITSPGIEAGQGVTEWLVAGHTVDELRRLVKDTPRLQKAEVIPPPTVDDNPEDPRRDDSPWRHTLSVSEFLAESSHEVPWLVKDLLARGAITMWAVPFGVGKTLVSIKLARELAIGEMFRQQTLAPVRVLYLNRDNPKDAIAARLQGWEVPDVPNFRLMKREKVPELKDRDGWARFPVEYFDVVVIDSVGSSTEGITEREGRDTTKILATLLDLAAWGVAILLLNNTTKDGASVRGRGEWMDRVDILYEVRDATGFTPSGKKSPGGKNCRRRVARTGRSGRAGGPTAPMCAWRLCAVRHASRT
jgi:hypothetical protein